MNQPKTCPFCGGNDLAVVLTMHQLHGQELQVRCMSCSARGRRVNVASDGPKITLEEAIEITGWNTRAPAPTAKPSN